MAHSRVWAMRLADGTRRRRDQRIASPSRSRPASGNATRDFSRRSLPRVRRRRHSCLLRALDEADDSARSTAPTARASRSGRPTAVTSGSSPPASSNGFRLLAARPKGWRRYPTGWPAGSWSQRRDDRRRGDREPRERGMVRPQSRFVVVGKIRAFAADRPINPDKAFPSFLPDGEHFLFTHPVGDVATLQVGSIRSDETRALVPADSRAFFARLGRALRAERDAVRTAIRRENAGHGRRAGRRGRRGPIFLTDRRGAVLGVAGRHARLSPPRAGRSRAAMVRS